MQITANSVGGNILAPARAITVAAIAYVLIGCGGSSRSILAPLHGVAAEGSGLSTDGNNVGSLTLEALSTGSDENPEPEQAWHRPAGSLIDVPWELRDEFAAVHDGLRHRRMTGLGIANSGGLEQRRALAYYLFGNYRGILPNKLVVITAPAPPGATTAMAGQLASEVGGRVSRTCHLGGRNIHYLEFAGDRPRAALAAAADAILLNHQPVVVYCGAELYLSYADSPPDPHVKYELGQCYSPLQVSALLAWETTRGAAPDGEPVLVALFDSGFYRDINDDTYLPQGEHEDLEGVCYNLGDYGYQVNFSGSAGEDIYSPWEDLSDPSPINYPYQTLGHGTRVAGVIAAQANQIGVAGIAPDVKIVPFRLYVHTLPYIPVGNFTAAAEVCAEAKAAGHPIRVVNISAHVVEGEETPDLELAVRALSDAGMLIVSTATGNDPNAQGPEPFWLYPAAYKAFADGGPIPNIVAVAWLGIDNRFKDFYSEAQLSEDDWDWSLTDVFAPSEHMMLTNADGGYISDPPAQASGVSFGIPVVAGIAALYIASNAQSTAAEVKQNLISAARPIYNFGLDASGNAQYRKAYAGLVGLAEPPIHASSTQFVCDSYAGVISPDSLWGESRSSRINVSSRDFQQTDTEIVVINDTFVEYLDQISSWTSALLSIPVYSGGAHISYDYYTRARTPWGWVAWGDPRPVFSSPERVPVSDYSESAGGGYIIFSPSNNAADNYLVNYGAGTAATGLEPSEYPLELLQGNGGIDTLLRTEESVTGLQRIRWHIWGQNFWPAAVESCPPENLCVLGSLGQHAGCAWLNPDSNTINIGQVDFAQGSPFMVEWDYSPALYLEELVADWPHGRSVEGIALAGSPQELHYLVVASRNFVPGGSSVVVEGIRVMTNGGFDQEPIIEPLLALPVATETTEIKLTARIDHGNRLFIFYELLDGGAHQAHGFYRQTLDYGNP